MQILTSSALEPSSVRWLSGRSLLPGLFLTTTITTAAFGLRNLSGIAALSPLIIAIALGLVFHNTVGTPAAFRPGVVFGMRRVLRFALILLGLQLSLAQVVEVGAAGLGIIALTLDGTFRPWIGLPNHQTASGPAVSLTEAGRLFLSEAVAAISQLDRAEQVGRLAARGELGQIEVGYVTSAAMNRTLPCLLREYRRSHLAVQLRLTAMETPRQLDALAEGRLDAALIRPRPGYAAGVAAHVIHREALCVALAADHPLMRSHTLQAADLGNEAFIVPQAAESSGFGSHLERLAAKI